MLDAQSDLVVMGGGIAGLIAALAAAESGLHVIVCEKLADERYVCNSRMTGGIFHLANNPIHADEAMLIALIEDITAGASRPDLVRAVVRDAKRAVRWLQDRGIRFIKASGHAYQSHVLAPPASIQIGRPWQGRGGDITLRRLEARLVALGGRLLRGHRVTAIDRRDGRIAGVSGVDLHGVPFSITARAVVVADGGFQASTEAVSANISPAPAKLVKRNAGTGFGDGLRLAQSVGAALSRRSEFYGHLQARNALTNDNLWPYPWCDEIGRSAIVVDSNGDRFVDEGLGGVHIANAIARLADPASTTIVFDATVWEGPARQRALPVNPYLERAGGVVHRAATLEEVARIAGLPAATLTQTVDRYNRAIADSRCDMLQPTRTTAKFQPYPITTAPFYVLPIAAGITYTMGGILIDADARALDESDMPIDGLYAVGSCTGGLEGGPKTGYVGGLCKAAVTGLRAGEHLASYIRSSIKETS
jgi:fumarate reductase flavoprotein subunit